MLTLNQFIEKRLKDDKKNLLDLDMKESNLQDCVNYVFEYFNTYINVNESRQMQIEIDEKIEKYFKQIEKYSTDVQAWLIDVYSKYNKKLNQQIPKFVREIDIFLLTNSPESFRKYSYKCYSQLIKKYPFMDNYIDELYDFIVDQHRVDYNDFDDLGRIISFNEKIDKYVMNTSKRYGVNVLAWAQSYASSFYDYDHMWAVGTYEITEYGKEYNPLKAKKNKFNIDHIYSQLSTLPYIKGKKKVLEILVMYYWQQEIAPVDEDEYEAYMKHACDSV